LTCVKHHFTYNDITTVTDKLTNKIEIQILFIPSILWHLV